MRKIAKTQRNSKNSQIYLRETLSLKDVFLNISQTFCTLPYILGDLRQSDKAVIYVNFMRVEIGLMTSKGILCFKDLKSADFEIIWWGCESLLTLVY